MANPPYVSQPEYADLSPEVAAFEPKDALTPGETGLEAFPAVAATAQRTLKPAARSSWRWAGSRLKPSRRS